MKPFIAVIGGRNSGKSTVISSLTGCPTHRFRNFVVDLASSHSIFVIASSPQEDPLTSARLTRILNQVTADSDCLGIVIAIQPTKPYSRLSIEQIFTAVQNTHEYNIHAFSLDPGYNGAQGSTAALQTRLNPLGVHLNQLSAQRFAFASAADINISTRLI